MKKSDHVWMVQLFQDSNLLEDGIDFLERFLLGLLLSLLFEYMNLFDSNLFPIGLIQTLVYLSISTLANHIS